MAPSAELPKDAAPLPDQPPAGAVARKTSFRAGQNIALKVPSFKFAETVAFYKDVLGLPYLGARQGSEVFQFGAVRLWIDDVPSATSADVWLEVRTDDVVVAADWLTGQGVPIRDELEPLDGFDGHWISDPSGNVLLMCNLSESRAVPSKRRG